MSPIRVVAPLAAAAIAITVAGCGHAPTAPVASKTAPAVTTPAATALASTTEAAAAEPAPPGATPELASDPAQIGDNLVADELALRDPSTPEDALNAAARRQQVAYRAIGRHPEWDAIIRPKIPPELLGVLRPQHRGPPSAGRDGDPP